jgi:hypothetical protein
MCDALAARILQHGDAGMGRRELMRQLERAMASGRRARGDPVGSQRLRGPWPGTRG